MEIFDSEIADGIAEQITSKSSISYASLLAPCENTTKKRLTPNKTIAGANDSDLYYVQSILVTSSWNKNDDIFDPIEVWRAKDTPEDKPTNLEHDESNIIGHIVANWPITDDGEELPVDMPVSEIPKKYHIVTGSVIYRGFTNPELKERAEKLISEIESGNKFVSMECFFNGFDYGLINKTTGEYKILPRNNNTAHLTKFLRAYGGIGEHENYKIGRVLRNITFSGKGFVNKPANPDSIIFSKDSISEKKINNLAETGVCMNKSTSNEAEINEMSADTITETTTEEVVAAPVESTPTEQTATLMPTAPVKQDEEDDKEDTDGVMKAYQAMIEKMKAELDTYMQTVDKKNKETDALRAELAASQEALAAYKKKEEEMLKKEKKMSRIAKLLEIGVSNELATSTVDNFENIDDKAFEAMANIFASQTKTSIATEQAEASVATESVKTETKAVDATALDNVEVEETVNLTVGSEDITAVDSTRAELLEFVCARLGKKLNKGE